MSKPHDAGIVQKVSEPQINWTKVGAEYNATDRQRSRIQGQIDRMEWLTPPFGRLPMAPGLGLEEMINQWGRALQVSYNAAIGPFALLAIETPRKNGLVRIYCFDIGTGLVPVRSDFWPKD